MNRWLCFGKTDSKILFLAHAILVLYRSGKSRIANSLVHYVYGENKFNNRKLPIPDYALDMPDFQR